VPFELAYRPDGVSIVLAHHSEVGVRSVMVEPHPAGDDGADSAPTGVVLGPDTAAASDVLSTVEETEFEPGWSIVTPKFRCVWPKGTSVWSTPNEIGWDFELTLGEDPGDAMTYVQGPLPPAECLSLDAMIGEGMRAGAREKMPGRAGEGEWLELHYERDGVAWIQRRNIMPLGDDAVALVTAQAPEPAAEAAFAVAAEVAKSIALRGD
jgi:hypothetical protein